VIVEEDGKLQIMEMGMDGMRYAIAPAGARMGRERESKSNQKST